MEMIVKEENGIVSLKVAGRLDAESSILAEKQVRDIIDGGITRILFDFSDLDYISSAGLRVILMTIKELRAKDGRVVLCSLNEYVQEVFDVSNFSSIIPITASCEEGFELLSQA
jgi:anti-anti-sigma factor